MRAALVPSRLLPPPTSLPAAQAHLPADLQDVLRVVMEMSYSPAEHLATVPEGKAGWRDGGVSDSNLPDVNAIAVP